ISIASQRRATLRPIGQQQLAPATRKSQVHPRCRAQAFCSVVVPGMEKIAVSVDVHESSSASAPHSMQAAKKDAAVTANDYRESMPRQDLIYFLRQSERECTNRQTVADSRPRLSLELIGRSLERYNFLRIEC